MARKPLTHKTFTSTSVALAISAALLLGCSADKTAQTARPVITDQNETFKDEQFRSEIARIKTDKVSAVKPKMRERDSAVSYRNKQSKTVVAGATTPSELTVLSQVQQPSNRQIQAQAKRHSAAATGMPMSTTEPTTPPRLDYAEVPQDRERYAIYNTNPLKSTRDDPLSTFGIDVDTASYAIARQDLNQGRLPRSDSVRTEEWLNYFSYDYPAAPAGGTPFSVYTEVAPAPWADNKYLLAVGLKGDQVAQADLPPLNLTFLVDVSGSMQAPNKLPLAKAALKMLVKQLRPQDRVAIAVYAGAAGLVLDSTAGSDKPTIIGALERLRSGGSTAGGAGIQLAYKTARQQARGDAISRVILLSDGDFNVGTTNTEALKALVERERASGVSLSVLTFGRGNIRDELMNSLAEIGNGNAGYIDSAHEAKKYLVDEMAGSMMTIAKDVKAQIEFNPAVVSEYRLLGYETRHLQHHEFNDDSKDAGEIGAGHEVTALYELTLTGSEAALTPALRYSQQNDQQHDQPHARQHAMTAHPLSNDSNALELAFLKLRYKQPDGESSALITQPIYRSSIKRDNHQASDNFRWAAAVAGAAQKARGIRHLGHWRYGDSLKLAKSAVGRDTMGYRAEFLRLMAMAESLQHPLQIGRHGVE